MEAEFEKMTPSQGNVSIDIRVSAPVNISSFSARQKVTGYVADHISTQLHAGEPTLLVGDRICWRVPVVLSLPPDGDLGEVGAVDVDVETGQMSLTPAATEEIQARARSLAAGTANPAKRTMLL